MSKSSKTVQKLATGIEGFDHLAEGGLPKGRATVVSGPPGSGKTIFGLEFLYKGVTQFGDNGVFVTFEERPDDLKREVAEFGWNIGALERKGNVAFVDASSVNEHQIEVGEYDFGALVARIRYAVAKVGAKRVVIDGIASLFLRYRNEGLLRRELFKIIDTLRRMDVTTVITAERVEDSDVTSRFGVEDFVADSVVYLYNSVVGRERERRIEIVKLRGASHQTGLRPFIIAESGITVFPGRKEEFANESPTERLSIGVSGIDAMTDGGIFRGSTTLLLGPSGTGRTVMGLQFVNEGVRRKERSVIFSFEEGPAQLKADAKAFGWNFASAERSGLLKIVAFHPESMPLESYLKRMREVAKEFRPKRVVIDSVTPLAHAVGRRRFRDFIISLNSYLKGKLATTIVNYTIDKAGSDTSADDDMAVVADNIIEVDFVSDGEQMDRVIAIKKSRASVHDKRIRRYDITKGTGICVLSDDGKSCLTSARPKKTTKRTKKRPAGRSTKKRKK